MIKKNILLIIKNFKDRKEEKFFYDIKNLLNEKGQNRVSFYFVRDKDAGKEGDSYYGGIGGIFKIIKKEKINIIATAFALPNNFLKLMVKNGVVAIAINVKDGKNFDISLDVDYDDETALIPASQKISIVDKLNWDTNFFGFNIAKLNHEKIKENIIKLVLGWCVNNKIKCLYYAAGGSDWLSIRLAEKHGFGFVNIRVTYSLAANDPQRAKKNKYNFRKAKKSDLSSLIKMTKNLYLDSKYYFDKNFPDKLCDKFYSTWIKKLALSKNKGENVYVLADSGKPIAYIASGAEYGTVHIFLVAVDCDYQKKGLGKLLINEFIRFQQKLGYKNFKVVTQGRNIAALRLYQSYGFKIVSEQIEYHKWF